MAENKQVEFGAIKVDLLAEGVLKTLEAFDKQPTAAWITVGTTIGVPIEPWDKRLAKPVLFGAVQAEWYKAFENGSVPALCISNQVSRVKRYKQQLDELKNNDGKDVVAGVKKERKAKEGAVARVAKTYVLVEGAVLPKTGQKYIVAKTLTLGEGKVGGKGMTVLQVFEQQKEIEGIIPPSNANVAFHMNAFAKEGLIQEILDGKLQGTITIEKEKDETPKAEKPKATGKKK